MFFVYYKFFDNQFPQNNLMFLHVTFFSLFYVLVLKYTEKNSFKLDRLSNISKNIPLLDFSFELIEFELMPLLLLSSINQIKTKIILKRL